MKRVILVTGAGGGGSTNLINSLRSSPLELSIIGSNLSPYILAKSTADKNQLLPAATEPRYVETLSQLVENEGIELVVPNSDREVRAISEHRAQLPCRVFLPPHPAVELCQDKYAMYVCLKEAGLSVARSYSLTSYDDIQPAIEALSDTGERFWVRPRRGSGSKGATWVRNAEQAQAWISLWEDLRGYPLDTFTISEFLPGRDYAFQSVWQNGKLVVAKLCERLSYFFGENRLSGMSSTPAVARTVHDQSAIDTALKAIHAICDQPHGNFNLDMKADATGNMNITECNIGRFFMITPIFDLTGKVNTAETYVRCAFEQTLHIENPIDIEEDMYLLRDLDTLPKVTPGKYIRAFESGM